MRHLRAVQVDLGEQGQGWHYASTSRRGGHPLGYCAEHPPHATEQEARVCYRLYQRAHVKIGGRNLSWTSCTARPYGEKCPHPARDAAWVEGDGYALAPLCSEHLSYTHALVALHLDDDKAGDSWES